MGHASVGLRCSNTSPLRSPIRRWGNRHREQMTCPRPPQPAWGRQRTPQALVKGFWGHLLSPPVSVGKWSQAGSTLWHQVWPCDWVWPIRAFGDRRLRDWLRNRHVTQPGPVTLGDWGPLEVIMRAIFATTSCHKTESQGPRGEIHRHPQPCGVRVEPGGRMRAGGPWKSFQEEKTLEWGFDG